MITEKKLPWLETMKKRKKRIDICKIRNRKIRGTAFIRKGDYGISWRVAYVPPV